MAASSASTSASCSASSLRASDGFHRPRSNGMLSRKKMIPPKQIQYQVFHSPGAFAAAAETSAACAAMNASTDGGTLASAASSLLNGVTSAITEGGTAASAFSWLAN